MSQELPVTRVMSEKPRIIIKDANMRVVKQKLPDVEGLSDESSDLVPYSPLCPKRATIQQLEFLAQCMERFPALALSKGKTKHALEHSQRKWRQIATALNKINTRFRKTGRAWLRYWTDMKFRVRRKYRHSGGRGEMTPFELRVLRILTDDEGNLLCKGSGFDLGTQEEPETAELYDFSTFDDDPISQPELEQVTVGSLSTDEDATNPTVMHDDKESIGMQDDGETGQMESCNYEDPIRVDKKNLEELQSDILRFKLRRQQEMHDLEVAQMRDDMRHKQMRHKLEMEILELKKNCLKQEFDRIKELVVTVQPRRGNRRNAN